MLIRYSPDSNGRAVRKALIYTKDEHSIKRDLIDPDAVRIISHLRNYGFEAYLVGGAVRDLLIGKTPKDFDIVTVAEPAKIKRLFRNSRIIGKRFRLVHIFFGEKIFEVSTFRSLLEGTVGNSFGTMDEDVQRRDFTLNALYYDPIKEQVIDYVGGVKDIRARKLKPVIPLKIIFTDDPVRMLRAIKYAVSTGSAIPFSLRRAIRKHSLRLQPVSPSRLTEEIIKILNSGNSANIVRECLRYDLFMYLQPGANNLLDGSASFSRKYAASLGELDALVASGEETRLGRKLVYLVRDLVEIVADTDGLPAEEYNRVYHECRRFIMPMNPPRVELEFAVRFCLKEIGINVRMPRNRDRSRGDGAEGREPVDESAGGSGHSRRRRHRRKPAPPISASN
jgi:poly(A) polymerase